MSKLVVIEEAQCVGCRQCELICSLKHEKSFSPWLARIHVQRDENLVLAEPVICRQCPDAPCKAACPVGAILKSEATGAYYVDSVECIGCLQCMEACQYQALVFNSATGVVMKCDLCGGQPACVDVCPANVLKMEV